MAIKAIRLARMVIENFVDGIELGKGGPIESEFVPEVIRVKAEVAILAALLDEVLLRKPEKQ